MHHDEEATYAKLTALLADSVTPAITEHGGRIVKNTGDGLLAEFSSVVEAVLAGTQFQTRIHELTIDDAEDRRILFRVGINIGDVIVVAHPRELAKPLSREALSNSGRSHFENRIEWRSTEVRRETGISENRRRLCRAGSPELELDCEQVRQRIHGLR
jgi:hypothetical protein